MYDNNDFLLHDMKYVAKLRRKLLSISMFDHLGYCTRVEHELLNFLHGGMIISKGCKICGLYIIKGSNIIVHSLLCSEDFHDKNKYGI